MHSHRSLTDAIESSASAQIILVIFDKADYSAIGAKSFVEHSLCVRFSGFNSPHMTLPLSVLPLSKRRQTTNNAGSVPEQANQHLILVIHRKKCL
jgi:hypothetical protein